LQRVYYYNNSGMSFYKKSVSIKKIIQLFYESIERTIEKEERPLSYNKSIEIFKEVLTELFRKYCVTSNFERLDTRNSNPPISIDFSLSICIKPGNTTNFSNTTSIFITFFYLSNPRYLWYIQN
jgi:hypothetical protein